MGASPWFCEQYFLVLEADAVWTVKPVIRPICNFESLHSKSEEILDALEKHVKEGVHTTSKGEI